MPINMNPTPERPQEDPRLTTAKLEITEDERFKKMSPQIQVESSLQTAVAAVRNFLLSAPDSPDKEDLKYFAEAAQEVLHERFDAFVELLPGLEAVRVGSQWIYREPKAQTATITA